MLRFTCGERKICSTIEKSMNMILGLEAVTQRCIAKNSVPKNLAKVTEKGMC